MRLKDIAETFKRELQDPEFVEGYLQDALADGTQSFLIALADVVKANQGMGKLAHEANISRESLYRALSENGNPHFTTIERVLKSLGMQISITRKTRGLPDEHFSLQEK